MKTVMGIIATIVITTAVGVFYYFLEDYFYSDFARGCSSTGTGYYPVMSSRLIGYCMLLGSATLFIAGIWRIKGLTRLSTIPAILTFGIAFYGNGYMLFNKGVCGFSLNQRTFFIHETKLGDFAKVDGEMLNIDSLQQGKLKGKLLGYSFKGNELTAFRIGEEPLKIKTNFLFWKIRSNVILNDLSYGLNTFERIVAENEALHYEFIGGQGMSEKDFLDEFVLTQKELSGNLKNKRIVNSADGTTRFLFEK